MENSEAALKIQSHFELRVSLGDMSLEDAFRATLDAPLRHLTVGGLLNSVFPEDEAARFELLETLDTRAYPDLPEMYDELLDIFDQWRRGDCTLTFFARRGSKIELFRSIEDYLSYEDAIDRETTGYPVLDLVLSQRYEVLAQFAEWGGDEGELFDWLGSLTLLYFMDKHGFRLGTAPPDELDKRLLPIAQSLEAEGLIAESENTQGTQSYQITVDGRQLIGEMLVETESYIDSFDVFNDVLYDLDAQSVEFGTGHGDDLRVQVYESEGLDPIKVVFLLRLYDESLDQYTDSWRDRIHNEEFFDEVLQPVLNHDIVDEDLIGWIIESGYAHNEEGAEEAREQASQRDALRRMRADGPPEGTTPQRTG